MPGWLWTPAGAWTPRFAAPGLAISSRRTNEEEPPAMIDGEDVEVGVGTVISPTAVIRGLDGPARRIRIGDHCYIGDGVQIICDDFELGDYSKLHHHTTVHGYLPCHIGHNAWVGQFTVIDSVGSATIGNNCGIGAHSQLWSHAKYGDVLEGCRFNSSNPLVIGDDVWFVGHCIVSPIHAMDKSMALAGSVVTQDMAFNTIYAGTPAKPISDRVGPQFAEPTDQERRDYMSARLAEFADPATTSNLRVVMTEAEASWSDDISYFILDGRSYTKKGSQAEVAFMKYLLPEKAKFVPLTRP